MDKIGDNSFVLVDDKARLPSEAPYPNVKKITGNNLSTGVKVAIVVGIVLVIVAIIGGTAKD